MPQHPRHSACCTVVAERVKKPATLAAAGGGGEVHSESPKEEDTKEGRVKGREGGGWGGRENGTRPRAALGPEKGLAGAR